MHCNQINTKLNFSIQMKKRENTQFESTRHEMQKVNMQGSLNNCKARSLEEIFFFFKWPTCILGKADVHAMM